MNKVKKPRGFKALDEYIAFRAEDGNVDNIEAIRMYYGLSSHSELLRLVLTRFIQLYAEGIHIIQPDVLERVIRKSKEE